MPRPANMVGISNVDATADEITAAGESVLTHFQDAGINDLGDHGGVELDFEGIHEAPEISTFSDYLGYLAIILDDAGIPDAAGHIVKHIDLITRYHLAGVQPLIPAYEIAEGLYGRANVILSQMPEQTLRMLRRAIDELREDGGELEESTANLLEDFWDRGYSATVGLSRMDTETKLKAELPGYEKALDLAYMTLAQFAWPIDSENDVVVGAYSTEALEPITFLPVDKREIVRASDRIRQRAAAIPVMVEEVEAHETFALLGFDEAPSPTEFAGYVSILLANCGVADADKVVIDHLELLVEAYAAASDPVEVADILRVHISGE